MRQFSILFLSLLFITSCTSKQIKIAIQPFEDIPLQTVDSMSVALEKSYDAQVVILQERNLPKSAFINVKSPRYRADLLLTNLLEYKPDSMDYIIGVTKRDISTTKRNANGKVKHPESKYYDWGIFGLGSRPGKSCILSTFRLSNTSTSTFYDRIQKIAVHEIGHNLGLPHCSSSKCVMQDAVETIKTVDSADKQLCKRCRGKI